MRTLSYIVGLLVLFSTISCKKDDIVSIRDAQATNNAITVTNYKYFERIPIVETSISAGGKVDITMALPADSPRSFKEITRVAASTINASINASSVQRTTGLYQTAIAASGKSITYSTTLADYMAFKKLTAMPSTTTGGIVTYTDMQFFFLITLDDNSTVIPYEIRARIRQ
ncbi:hypothetical protein [Spirosoma sp. KNUC1025]|uniref:hypothetical protein n=1 Tax=Spirosoma sp. KNUC1025 TaxID=2894082 RepID=UPI0038637F22|nr:hypothetical protein LN737_01835 [Spirosoma sp. KNUC1025]